MSNTLGRIDFRGRLKTSSVEIPELGGSVRLREIESRQLAAIRNEPAYDEFAELARCIVDDNDQRIYTTEEDIDNLRNMGISIFRPLFAAMQELNGVGAKAAEETQKNLRPVGVSLPIPAGAGPWKVPV